SAAKPVRADLDRGAGEQRPARNGAGSVDAVFRGEPISGLDRAEGNFSRSLDRDGAPRRTAAHAGSRVSARSITAQRAAITRSAEMSRAEPGRTALARLADCAATHSAAH